MAWAVSQKRMLIVVLYTVRERIGYFGKLKENKGIFSLDFPLL